MNKRQTFKHMKIVLYGMWLNPGCTARSVIYRWFQKPQYKRRLVDKYIRENIKNADAVSADGKMILEC